MTRALILGCLLCCMAWAALAGSETNPTTQASQPAAATQVGATSRLAATTTQGTQPTSAAVGQASSEVESAKKLMDAAKALDETDPAAASARYEQAIAALDRADSLVANAGKTQRIEIVRRRISAIRRSTDADATAFDKAMDNLGQQNVSPEAYRSLIEGMIGLLDKVRDRLNTVLEAVKPFSQELVLEMKWAEFDLKRIESMRKVLQDELAAE